MSSFTALQIELGNVTARAGWVIYLQMDKPGELPTSTPDDPDFAGNVDAHVGLAGVNL